MIQSACPSKAASAWVVFVASFQEDASSGSFAQQPRSAHLGRAGTYPAVSNLSPGFILVSGSSGLYCFPVENSDCASKTFCDWFPFSETKEILHSAIVGQMHILLLTFLPLNIRI